MREGLPKGGLVFSGAAQRRRGFSPVRRLSVRTLLAANAVPLSALGRRVGYGRTHGGRAYARGMGPPVHPAGYCGLHRTLDTSAGKDGEPG